MRSIAGVNLRNVPRSDVKRNVCALHCANNVGSFEKKFSEKPLPDPPPGRPAEGRYFGTFDPPLQWGPGRGVCDNNVARDIESRDRVDGRPPGNET